MKIGKDYIGVGCGALIIDESGEKTFLLKRSNNSKNGRGEWNRPGGTVEFGEKLEEAVKREIREEVGVEIKILKPLGYTDHLAENEHWISFGFLARVESGVPKNMEPDKHDEVGWYNFNQLPNNLAQPTEDGINQYLREKNEGRN